MSIRYEDVMEQYARIKKKAVDLNERTYVFAHMNSCGAVYCSNNGKIEFSFIKISPVDWFCPEMQDVLDGLKVLDFVMTYQGEVK